MSKYLNVDALKSHFDGDEEMIRELLEIFESTYEEILIDAINAANDQSYSDLEHAAHTLKGMVANFFSEDLKNAAFELEKMGKNGELIGDVKPILDLLTTGIPDLIQEVKSI